MKKVATGLITIVDTNDGVSLVLDRYSILVPTGADGAAIAGSFTNCAATAKIMLGAVDDTANWTITTTPSAAVTGSKSGATYTVTGLSADTGEVVFTASRPGFSLITASLILTKAKAGTPGLNTATITLYQRASSETALAKPSLTATYTFSTGVLSNINNGWSQTIPVGDASKPYLQVTTATAISTTDTDNITTTEWAAVRVMTRDGAEGVGTPGKRGNVDVQAATTGSAWSDAEAVAAIANNGYGTPQQYDTVTLYNTATKFTQTRFWNSGTWTQITQRINGNILMPETVYAGAVDTRGLTVKDLDGNILLGVGTPLSADLAAPGTKNSEQKWADISGPGLPTASKGSALNLDPSLENAAEWDMQGITIQYGTTAAGYIGSRYFTTSTANRAAFSKTLTAIDPTKTYNLTANLYSANNTSGKMFIVVDFFDSAGDRVTTPWGGSYSGYLYGNTPPLGKFTLIGDDFGAGTPRAIPATARTARVGILFNNAPTGALGEQAAQELRLTEVTAVRAAKAVADAAKARTDAMASDSTLDRSEKIDLIREWAEEDKIWAKIKEQAASLGVSSTDYDTKHNAASAYLMGLSPAWNDTTQDTAINRTTFRDTLNAMYEARVVLQNAIAAKAATTASWDTVTGRGKPQPGRGLAMNEDPQIENADVWSLGANVTIATGAGGNAACPKYLRAASGTDQHAFSRILYPVSSSRTYSLTAMLYAAAGNNRNIYIWVNFVNGAGNRVAPPVAWGGTMDGYVYAGQPPASDWTRQGGMFGAAVPNRPIPTTARWIEFGVWFQYSGAGTSAVEQGAQDIRLEDITVAAAAQQAIEVITNDGILSRDEKPALVLEWTRITNEKAQLEAQAIEFSIGNAKTLYLNAYTALSNYLPSGWNNYSVDTVVNRTTFNNTFADYYAKRDALVAAINSEGKARADAAKTAADSKLNNGADVLKGVLSVNTTYAAGLRVGTLTWGASGNITGGSGIALTPAGLVGYRPSGSLAFKLDTAGEFGLYDPQGNVIIASGSSLQQQARISPNLVGRISSWPQSRRYGGSSVWIYLDPELKRPANGEMLVLEPGQVAGEFRGWESDDLPLSPTEWYTVSFMATSNAANSTLSCDVYGTNYDSVGANAVVLPTDPAGKRFVFTEQVSASAGADIRLRIWRGSTVGQIAVWDVKVAKGKVDTPWSEDIITVGNAAKMIQPNSISNTQIGGDLLSTNYVYNQSGWLLQRAGNFYMPGLKHENGQLTLDKPVIINPRISTEFSVSINGISANNLANTTTYRSVGGIAATISNGVAPYTYAWTFTPQEGEVLMSGDPSGASISIKGRGVDTQSRGYVTLTITDNTGATARATSFVNLSWGVPR